MRVTALSLVLLGVAGASTPQEAAIRVVNFPRGQHIVVERTNIAGRLAMVYVRGGSIEGSRFNGLILLKHFSFGWQALMDLDERCMLRMNGITYAQARALMDGMPPIKENDPRACTSWHNDEGPSSDINAIRAQMHNCFIPFVTVADGYAMADWYGCGGGQDVLKKTSRGWHFIGGGGGAISFKEIETLGIPAKVACALHPYDKPRCS